MTDSSINIAELDLGQAEVRYLSALLSALEPLVKIADAFDANNLDDEARKFWGKDNEHECQTPHDKIELYTGRGGGTLLTLADCMRARELVRGKVPEPEKKLTQVISRRGRIRLLRAHSPFGAGSVLEYIGIVPHGGYTDSERQYILSDDVTHIPSDYATEIS